MEQKMKEEQERRKKKEMEERMSLEETKEQVSNPSSLPLLISPLPSPRLYLLILLPDSEAAGEAFSSTGGEAPAFLAAQKSFARGRKTKTKGTEV